LYLPNLAPFDFYLFPLLKEHFYGTGSENDVTKSVVENFG